MRYAFHGKMRTTGQVIDGFVEAANSEEAFDRLADQGIIGVHTVRAQPDPDAVAKSISTAAPASSAAPAEVILTQLVEKMNVLIGHVETLLTRPAGTAVGGRHESNGRKRRVIQQENSAQNETLKAIFQTNLELRRSIQKFNQMTAGAKPGHAAAAAPARSAPEMSLVQPPPRSRERALAAQPAA